ncbi:MAG: 2-hydroxychromene-2-carboxylate isomerase [Bacteriovoracaceae bacterium]|nr:2-hydroxychromene-2-carboxylate isomerase [Bacteriovoracaceae bacterium]
MKKLEYYFDFLSPYSYLSWNWVRNKRDSLKEKGIELEFLPIPMASLIQSHETKGPAQIKPKREYLFKDCLRFTSLHEIPFDTPKNIPFNSLYALRCATLINAGENQFDVIDTIFMEGWGRGEDIGDPDVLTTLFEKRHLPGLKLLDRVGDNDVRKELKINLKRAKESNLFGVPSFIIDDEMFWGNDSIPWLERYFENKDPYSEESFKSFVSRYQEL